MKLIIHPDLGLVTTSDDDFYYLDTEKLPSNLRQIVEDQANTGSHGWNDIYDISVEFGEKVAFDQLLMVD